ncbi:hypothetical protein JCM8097_003128 [Rhodosporidiobolus ruineniae]
MAARPSLLSQNSSSRFPPANTRGSSSLASPGLQARSAAPGDNVAAAAARKKSGPSLSLGRGGNAANGSAELHPLKHTWDVWFSQRTAGNKNVKKDEQGKAVNGEKLKESREDWEGGVVKLGGFSSIESLHPFLAHLVPPSALPASTNSTYTLFSSDSPDAAPPAVNLICDYNIFRASIAPAWEDAANVGGGRWVIRLRKGVADRIWEEVVYALVSERIGGEDERTGDKINGVVLSVRKDEDILSLWVASSSRAERDIIRDSLRSALQPLLTPTASTNLQLDYKPHPNGTTNGATPNRLVDLSNGTDSPSPRHRRPQNGDAEQRRTYGEPSTPGAIGERRERSSRGFGGYISRTTSEGGFARCSPREGSPAVGVIGSGAFGRPRLGQRSESARGELRTAAPGGEEDRAVGTGSWGRLTENGLSGPRFATMPESSDRVTPPEQHSSGWDVDLKLEEGVKRSGQVLRGQVEVKARAGVELAKVSSLLVRCYWQSTVVYTTFSVLSPSSSFPPVPGAPAYTDTAEYHRGYAPTGGEGLDIPIGSSLDASSAASFDFAFPLPTLTHSNFANPSWLPPASRHDLMKFERCAPPSFDTNDLHDGTVEWIVEVLLRTEPVDGGRALCAAPSADDLPPFNAAPAAVGDLSSRGLLRSTSRVLVQRRTFQFEPLDRFTEDYQASWLGKAEPMPSLGRDPRDELSATQQVEVGSILPDRLVEQEGGDERWMTYFKEIALKGGPLSLGKKTTQLRAEISFSKPLRLSRSASFVPCILHLRHFHPSSKGLFGSSTSSSGSASPRLAKVEKLTLVLVKRILKRGVGELPSYHSGSAVRPTMDLKEIRREEILLGALPQAAGGGDLSRESTASGVSTLGGSSPSLGRPTSREKKALALRLRAAPAESTASSASLAPTLPSFDGDHPLSSIDVPLSFSLRTPSSANPSSPSLGLTFRTPNLEREYILSASLAVSGCGTVVIARVPMQVVVGDEQEEDGLAGAVEPVEQRDAAVEGRLNGEKLPLYAP